MDGPLISLEMLRNRAVHVIGDGVLGTRIIDNLCCYRVPQVITYDPDTYEGRNRYNQRIIARDIGLRKPDAMVRLAKRIDPKGTHIEPRYVRVSKRTKLSGFVFVMVDTMRDRKIIWENCIKENPKISLMIEARMGVYAGKVYGVDPCNPNHVHKWEEHSQYDDDPDVLRGCKAEFPAPSTADMVAGEAMWRFLNWLQLEQGSANPYYNYVGFNQLAKKKKDQNEREVW